MSRNKALEPITKEYAGISSDRSIFTRHHKPSYGDSRSMWIGITQPFVNEWVNEYANPPGR